MIIIHNFLYFITLFVISSYDVLAFEVGKYLHLIKKVLGVGGKVKGKTQNWKSNKTSPIACYVTLFEAPSLSLPICLSLSSCSHRWYNHPFLLVLSGSSLSLSLSLSLFVCLCFLCYHHKQTPKHPINLYLSAKFSHPKFNSFCIPSNNALGKGNPELLK